MVWEIGLEGGLDGGLEVWSGEWSGRWSGRWVWEAVCSDSWVWRRSGRGSRATKARAKGGDETRGAQQPKLMHREEVGSWRWVGRQVGR